MTMNNREICEKGADEYRSMTAFFFCVFRVFRGCPVIVNFLLTGQNSSEVSQAAAAS
jgi:hypothetical protein